MDKEQLREEVTSQIRACLVSTKGKCDLRQIKNDYYMLMGCEIPYTQLGYKNLEQFVCSIPTLTTTRLNGQLYVDAKITEKSSHISSFVNRQKTSKKKSRPQSKQTYRKESSVPARWRPKYNNNNWKKSFETPPRLTAVAHAQVVSSTKSPEKVRLKHERIVYQNLPPQNNKIESTSLTKQAKRRLSQKMADLPFEDLTIEAKSLQIDRPETALENKFLSTGDFLADLRAFALQNNLGDVVIKTSATKKNPRSPPIYYSKIQVEDVNFSSYPIDSADEETSVQLAAKKALNALEEQHRVKPKEAFLISMIPDILKRIPPMVKLHQYGVWNREIEDTYSKQYNEQLPVNWVEIVDSLPYISVIRIHGQFVLNFCDSKEKKNFTDPATANVSVLPNTVKFNDDDMLVAEITCISSAGEVWCCQRDTPESNSFYNMVAELENYYNTNGLTERASTIQIGGHYVALYEQTWCRVRVFEVNGDDIVCFCIDFGDEWVVKKNGLFNLNSKFAVEQAQAFVCRLVGVEELYEASKTSECIQTFLGKYVQVQAENNSDDLESDPNNPAIPVILYDLETGDPINEQIITLLSIEMALPSLTINTPTEAHVTQALDDGTVYIQIRSKGFEHLMSLIDKAGQNILSNKSTVSPKPVSKSNSAGTYFIQCHDDGMWHRVKIIDWSPFNEKLAQVMFLDTGRTNVTNVKETSFYALDDVSDVISKFPNQGYLVRLSLKNIPPNFVDRINELMPTDEAVLVKSLRFDEDYVPIVEFFKRSESDNILFLVNMTISADNELKSNCGDGNNNSKSQSKKLQKLMSLNQFDDVMKNMPSTGTLTCPKLPELGNYFDVKIPCAVHPFNFFVQPYESRDKLNKLMQELQDRYKDIQYSPISISDVSPGKIYTSKHKDGKWYRTSVIKVIHSGSISVFYCDFGYYGNLSVHDLIPLDVEFLTLPYQAIKAKLADVQPKNSNWSVEDCQYFSQLVCKKSFVSVLKGIEKDVLYRSDTVLVLELIDTSTSEDVFIHKLLVDRGVAISSAQCNAI